MEAGFLNFHDEEHFSDFSLSLDDQHTLLGETQNALERMVDNDFDYIEGLDLDSNDDPWETEQELNGDLAVLPVSGVAGVIPKIENIKEDFAKVLTDWQEHIGYLQSTELEEDIDMVNLDIGLDINPHENSYTDQSKIPNNVLDSPKSSEESEEHYDHVYVDTTKHEPTSDRINRVSESDQSEKEIDVVGLDLIEDVNPVIDSMHVRRQHATSPSKDSNYKSLGNRVTIVKEESLDDIVIKEESLDMEDVLLSTNNAALIDQQFSKSGKRKNSKKNKKKDANKKNDKNKKIAKMNVKVFEKSKTEVQSQISIEETNNSNSTPLSSKKAAVLEAGDVKSLLEQFEATEMASNAPKLPEISQMPKIPLKKNSVNPNVNNCQTTMLKKPVEDQNSKIHQDIRDSLPKEVIDRIKASGRKRMISVIPAMPNKKNVPKSAGTRMQEAAATLSRNKLLKVVSSSNSNLNARLDGSVQLDHDYCSSSNASSTSSSSSNSNTCSDNSRTATASGGNGKVTAKKSCPDSGSKKDSGLESGEASDASEEPTPSASRVATPCKPAAPTYEMKIQSALAASILQQRKAALAGLEHKPKQQMVSVLKRQQPAQKLPGNNLVESIVTTTNSSNGQVQNIIVQESSEARVELQEEQQQPIRRKLNLAEYRSRRFEQNRSDGSRTSSPVQPMALMYVHHASTSTEPMCCDREIVSLLKPKSELEEQKLRPRPSTEDKATQTAQSVFGLYTGEACCSIAVPAVQPEPTEPAAAASVDVRPDDGEPHGCSPDTARQPRKSRNYRRARASSSSSAASRCHSRTPTRRDNRHRNRSRSLSRSRSRSRSHSHSHGRTRGRSRHSRSRSRSRSAASRRSRRYTRRRRISHRRSSVSSSSSWSSSSRSSSRSRSRQRPRTRSRSISRSSSRSSSSRRYRSSSRSSSKSRSSRYSSGSRSPTRSKSERFKRSARQGRRTPDSSYDGYGGHSSASSRGYTNYRRKPYDEWYVKEKQRQVEERRVIYVGRLKDGITKAELRRRFEAFGPVADISIHFRERGHNYGFVTFDYKNDAYQAVEHGNDDPTLPRYDLCFGGRRAFCKVKYADLDGAADESMDENRDTIYKPEEENTFDLLLKEAQAKLRKRKV